VTALASAVVVLLVAVLKGAIGFGFPTVGTPLLALFLDVKTAVAILVPANIAMDSVQVRRRGSLRPTARRFWLLIALGGVGTVLGTRLLVALPSWVATLVLGGFVLLFVGLNSTPVSPRVPAHWEPWLSAPVGLIAGVVGGVTNVPGAPLVIYFYALGLEKQEFLRSVGLTFLVYKVVQWAALVHYGAFTWTLLPFALGLTAVALVGFRLGLAVQDRLDQRTFNRAVLVFLAVLGAWLIYRATR
jgi:uncharacterized protein